MARNVSATPDADKLIDKLISVKEAQVKKLSGEIENLRAMQTAWLNFVKDGKSIVR